MQSRTNPAAAHQIITDEETPLACTVTKWLWVSDGNDEHFAGATWGNEVKPYTTGKAYYADLLAAFEDADREILIAGWQVNWDALLAPGIRLFDALLKVAKRAGDRIKIVVMPWDDSAPVQTFDNQTKSTLLLINEIVGKEVIWVHLTKSLADDSRKFFSHHQKQVVVDRKIAFIGGIDLAYGRYDDDSFTLRADADGRQAMNRYNGCITPTARLDENQVVDTDLLTGVRDANWRSADTLETNRDRARKKIVEGRAWQVPYVEDGLVQEKTTDSSLTPSLLTLDPETQPRMPWQDIHCRIEGPAVSDLTRNFVQRWNAQAPKMKLRMPEGPEKYSRPGKCQVQVLRSASSELRRAEAKNTIGAPQGVVVQNDILQAMVELIKKSQHYIYIENQFFVGAFGESAVAGLPLSAIAVAASAVDGLDQTNSAIATKFGGGRETSDQYPMNPICREIAMRIDTAVQRKQDYHVIITLPVHPEGPLNNGAIMTQVHWTMQTLVFGDFSLLNQVRRSILCQQLREKKDANPGRAYSGANREYLKIPLSECNKYVTLLNLRNWTKLKDRYVTEQIYVHSKLMIVDDRYVLMGSANINDRSLLGGRDSELAVLIVDDQVEQKDICRNGKPIPVRRFAYNLRRDVWCKIFGISGKIRPAHELVATLDYPASPSSWLAIQKVASSNATLYEAAFGFIPRNKDINDPRNERSASIWPVWDRSMPQKRSYLPINAMPFQEKFWARPQHFVAGQSGLEEIRGFISMLPIEWTAGENNNLGYHSALVASKITATPRFKIDGETGNVIIAAGGTGFNKSIAQG